jgi:MFS family permease
MDQENKKNNEDSNDTNQETIQFNVGGPRAHLILIVMSLLLMINFMDRQVLSSVLELMKLDLHLSDTQAGFLQTAFLISMALFAYPVAYMIDCWSRRKAATIMALIWSVFTFITGLAHNFLGVLIPRILVGAGESAFQAGGTAWITAAYPKALRARVMGIFNAFIPLGAALGVILGGYLATRFDSWRAPFYIFAIPGIVLGLAAWFLKDYKTTDQCDETGNQVSILAAAVILFKIPTLKWLYIGYAMQNAMIFSFMTWSPAFIMRAQGATAAEAGMIVGVMSIIGIFSAPFGGILADKWQRKNPQARMLLPALTLFASTIFLFLGILSDFEGLGLVWGGLYGLCLMLGLPALSAATQDVVPPSMKGTAWGLNVFCQYVLGAGWAPLIVGILSDVMGGGSAGLKISLMITCVTGVIGSILFWVGSKHYPEDEERVRHFTLQNEK